MCLILVFILELDQNLINPYMLLDSCVIYTLCRPIIQKIHKPRFGFVEIIVNPFKYKNNLKEIVC